MDDGCDAEYSHKGVASCGGGCVGVELDPRTGAVRAIVINDVHVEVGFCFKLGIFDCQLELVGFSNIYFQEFFLRWKDDLLNITALGNFGTNTRGSFDVNPRDRPR